MSIYTYCNLCGNHHDSSACPSPVPCAECAALRAEVEALRGALRSAKPVYTTHKNSAAVRGGYALSGEVDHYTIEPHVLHAALAAGRE